MSGTTFPTRGDRVDCAWLTSVLRGQGALRDGRVSSFVLQTLADPGQTADLYRIVLQYEHASGAPPASLVAKFPAAYAPARELAHQYKSYVKEVLLEDLSAARNGTLFGDSRKDVETGLVQLARIHAAFWNLGRVNAATEDWKLADVLQAYAAEARAAQCS